MTTFILIGLIVALNVAFVWHLDRKDKRHQSSLDRLCQRLQAPEQAVLEHSAANVRPPEGPLFSNEFAEDEAALERLMMSEQVNGDR